MKGRKNNIGQENFFFLKKKKNVRKWECQRDEERKKGGPMKRRQVVDRRDSRGVLGKPRWQLTVNA